MAQLSGFKCDAPRCGAVIESQSLPPGWMTLQVPVDPTAAGRDPQKALSLSRSSSEFHLCSNRCLSGLGKDRYDAAVERGDETRPGRKPKTRTEDFEV